MKTVFAMLLFVSSIAQADVFSKVQLRQIPRGMTYKVTQPPVERSDLFAGKSIAILASHGVEESEITFPVTYLSRRGAQVDILVPSWTAEGIVASQFLMPTLFVKASGTFQSMANKQYDLVILTGGAWNAQVMRTDKEALALIQKHYQSRRPLAAICAGSAVLIDAGLARGRTIAGSSAIRTDLENAGAKYKDAPLAFSGNILSSRTPEDLETFVVGLRRILVGR